jgi:ribulose-5-phosphate 4-epimerase/fuculose-1-phosphate aldolase
LNVTVAADLAQANHILFDQGVLDGFGHVSVRDPERADRFFLSRNLAPALVRADDVLDFDLEGRVQAAGSAKVYLERFIHAAIYRARPEVMSVVHSHAAAILPFGAVAGARLCPICHMSGFLGAPPPVFEIRDYAGPASNMLITDNVLGDHLAERLGAGPVVLMRGHGMTVVGETLATAVFRSVYTVSNASIQLAAMGLGQPTFLNAEEAAAADEINQGQIGRAWEFWALSARRRIAAFAAEPLGDGNLYP